MSFVTGYESDIFVSYAQVDDYPSTGAKRGWVTTLVEEIQVQLAQRLGRREIFSIWKDEQLRRNVQLTPEIEEKLRRSALLLGILSPGYLESSWCLRELSLFLEFDRASRHTGSRVFVVERTRLDAADRPAKIADLLGYRFWENERGIARPISAVAPEFQPDQFYARVGELVTQLAEQMETMESANAAPLATIEPASSQPAESIELEGSIEALAIPLRKPDAADGLFVGIGEFDERSFLPRLRFAVDDALALAHLFIVQLGLIAPARTRLALGGKPASAQGARWLEELRAAGVEPRNATRSELLLALHELSESACPADGLLVTSFSTHGYDDRGTIYLMPQDGLRRFTAETGLSLSLLTSCLRSAGERKKILIVDACRTPAEGGIKGAETMSAEFERALKSAEGLAVLSSCSAGQSSWEAPALELGVFTHFLRGGILGGAKAREDDGVIALGDIFTYALAQTNQFVRQHIRAEQLPWCGGLEAVRDLPFAISRETRDRVSHVEESRRNSLERKDSAVRSLFEARRANRTIISVQLQEAVERELDVLAGDKLDELLESLDRLADRKPLSCKQFVAWWQSEHAAPEKAGSVRPGAGVEWDNSLGMHFVPIGDVLMCVHPTRVQDFKAFASEARHKATSGDFFVRTGGKWIPANHSWMNPGFPQTPEHPVVGMKWMDAEAFCNWLTERERSRGILSPEQFYSLPDDATWSLAVDTARFPWGDEWPPPTSAGNYAVGNPALRAVGNGLPELEAMTGTTAVGSFACNARGIYDLGGNVWEWCSDFYRAGLNPEFLRQKYDFLNDDRGGCAFHFLRGASWFNAQEDQLLSAYRNPAKFPDSRFPNVGFRCVLNPRSAATAAEINL